MAKQVINKRQSVGFTAQDKQASVSTSQPLTFQTGFDYMTTPGGVPAVDKAVTFPTAFTTILGVTCTYLGYKSGANPSGPTDLGSGAGSVFTTEKTLTNSGFTTTTETKNGGSFGANERHGFSWIAWGIL